MTRTKASIITAVTILAMAILGASMVGYVVRGVNGVICGSGVILLLAGLVGLMTAPFVVEMLLRDDQ